MDNLGEQGERVAEWAFFAATRVVNESAVGHRFASPAAPAHNAVSQSTSKTQLRPVENGQLLPDWALFASVCFRNRVAFAVGLFIADQTC